jgi:hypothetical protein
VRAWPSSCRLTTPTLGFFVWTNWAAWLLIARRMILLSNNRHPDYESINNKVSVVPYATRWLALKPHYLNIHNDVLRLMILGIHQFGLFTKTNIDT